MTDPTNLRIVRENSGSLLSPEDRERAIERARQRAERKVEEREHLRLELNARGYIHDIHDAIAALVRGSEFKKMQGTGEVKELPLDRVRVQALGKAVDASLRLLAKVLPDLKAVELTDAPERQADPHRLTTADLLKIVEKHQQKPAIPGEWEEIPKPPWE